MSAKPAAVASQCFWLEPSLTVGLLSLEWKTTNRKNGTVDDTQSNKIAAAHNAGKPHFVHLTKRSLGAQNQPKINRLSAAPSQALRDPVANSATTPRPKARPANTSRRRLA